MEILANLQLTELFASIEPSNVAFLSQMVGKKSHILQIAGREGTKIAGSSNGA